MISVRYILFIFFYENYSNFDVMSSFVKLMMDFFLTKIIRYHISINRRNDFYFEKYYFILVHNKTILKTINMQMVFDEMWHIVEYLSVNIFYSLIVFDWELSKLIIIFLHHV